MPWGIGDETNILTETEIEDFTPIWLDHDSEDINSNLEKNIINFNHSSIETKADLVKESNEEQSITRETELSDFCPYRKALAPPKSTANHQSKRKISCKTTQCDLTSANLVIECPNKKMRNETNKFLKFRHKLF
jgi:hypothetical protein